MTELRDKVIRAIAGDDAPLDLLLGASEWLVTVDPRTVADRVLVALGTTEGN